MTQEEKQLLLKDLCVRLPYGVMAYASEINKNGTITDVNIPYNMVNLTVNNDSGKYELVPLFDIKPYLRPISSITEEEAKQLNSILPCSMSFSYTTGEELIIYTDSEYDGDHYFGCFVDIEDWLNAHHFDYRGLIEKGLALEAPEGMYKNE